LGTQSCAEVVKTVPKYITIHPHTDNTGPIWCAYMLEHFRIFYVRPL
jgi:hypothetical protein